MFLFSFYTRGMPFVDMAYLRNKHIPLSVISDGMGHDSEHTTRIYLDSIDNSEIDMANKLILSSL